MADPMKIRANVVGDSTEVKVLMSHEMETGQRKDAQGKAIPAWFIQNVDRDVQRQDRARRRNGGRRLRRTRSCRSSSRAARRATRSRSPGSTTRATSAPTKRSSRDDEGRGRAPHPVKQRRSRMGFGVRARLRRSARCARMRSPPPAAFGQGSAGRRDREVPRGAAGRQSGRAVGGARRGPVEAEARRRRTSRSSAATSVSAPASSRAPTRSCRATSPTPTASWTSRRGSSGAW